MESPHCLLRDRRPDLLILDLMMPTVDGFAVLEAKAHDEVIRDIPVIILSAKDPERDPTLVKGLTVTRQDGLSAHDLLIALEAITGALTPRYAAPAPR